MDLATDAHLTLFTKVECYKLITDVYGPLPSGTVEIMLGQGGLTFQGFIGYSSIVDRDSKEEKIVANVKKEVN